MGEPRIKGGYILLSRQIIESEIWDKPPLYLKIWIYLLSKAQHKKYKNLDRGEVFISIPEIQENCSHYVGFRKEVPTYREVRNALDWMKNASNTDESRFPYERQDERQDERQANVKMNVNTNVNMIVTRKTTRGIVATIENYNVYQDPKNYEKQDERQHERQHERHNESPMNVNTKVERASTQGQTINKNDKNDKNDKNVMYKSTVNFSDKFIQLWNENFKTQITQTDLDDTLKYVLFSYSEDEVLETLERATNSNFLKGKTGFDMQLNFFNNVERFRKIRSGDYDDRKEFKKTVKKNTNSNLVDKDDRTSKEERQAFVERKLKEKIPIKIKEINNG